MQIRTCIFYARLDFSARHLDELSIEKIYDRGCGDGGGVELWRLPLSALCETPSEKYVPFAFNYESRTHRSDKEQRVNQDPNNLPPRRGRTALYYFIIRMKILVSPRTRDKEHRFNMHTQHKASDAFMNEFTVTRSVRERLTLRRSVYIKMKISRPFRISRGGDSR